jgi:F-type H+-transporting ATPase subunit gamma
MSGLKEIRTRISSIASTQKITSAMKMVSAAKFHKAQEIFFRFRPYSNKVMELLSQMPITTEDTKISKWFAKPQSLKKVALVVVTSNSSMCAGFNHNLLKKVFEDGPKLFSDIWCSENISIFCFGKKGGDAMSKSGFNLALNDSVLAHAPKFESIAEFCQNHLIGPFENGEFDAVYIAYNVFKNPAQQEPTISQFLPFNLPLENIGVNSEENIIFEPEKDYIMGVLIPMAAKTFFYEILLENAIGEHGSRMTAMHQATENASEITKQLKLQYNKARQAAITKEILEIVSGAEALRG